ncbi:MAG TPA: acyl-CoA dehydrogenase family protein [Rugosimonospora sp.]|nr:acyl-CoA dehydrogenase family protein [Rugosimonospora sp.]
MTTIVGTATATTTAVSGHDELVGRAAALHDELWEDAPTADRERRLTERSLKNVTDAGLFRLMTPRRFGGYEADMRTYLDVTAEVGRGCCATAWIVGVVNAGNFIVSLFPEQAQREVWADNADARTALVLGVPSPGVKPVTGGALISGEWPYTSGCLHAEWICLFIAAGARPEDRMPHLAVLRRDEVEIRDTWFFAGLRGTGSNTVVARDVFVPQRRIVPFPPFINGQGHLLSPTHRYRDSLMGLFSIGLLGPMLGGVRAAFEYVQQNAAKRPVAATTYANSAQSPTLQLDLADAAMRIDSARLHAGRLADTVDEFADAGENPDLLTRARARYESTVVTQRCREAMDLLLTAYGSSSLHEANPLQRIWRDINAASRHAGFGMGVPQQIYGRALVGMDPREISFLV